MGWTVLYIAFGVVALWLLGEVLLQYKARLRWRLLAFTGFLGVVVGVLLPSVLVIAGGAIAFAIGQTYVTMSFRKGFSTGWAIGGSPGASRRRKAASAPVGGPTLEVGGLAYEPVPQEEPVETTSVYEPQPLPDETGQYGIYSEAAYEAGRASQQEPAAPSDRTPQYTGATDPAAAYGAGFDGYGQGYGTQDGYAAPYDYGTGEQQQQYAAYQDPYAAAAPGGQQYDSYGSYDGYVGQQQYPDPYAPQYPVDTPPGGVWVPHQRDGEQVPPPPQEQPSPYGYDQSQGQGPGYGQGDQQYRY
ncbi:hypothetical protein [Streptomyces sp. SP18CS02]|uniref:hypothetical protein n=1 Tax=Streptomyces sp. SP18CS02 TaxID=3002531 RepID=UPI002E7AABC5|nr:hypothetical protein [Streptomyces sp. SP18CS02]MEE1755085.1 hypothetical protein [Streptomyces sp. SP18CS02]